MFGHFLTLGDIQRSKAKKTSDLLPLLGGYTQMARGRYEKNMGSTTSTNSTTPAMRIRFDIYGEVEECVRSGFGHADDAAIARGVDARDANDVTRADARAARAIVRSEGRQELHDLSIDIQRDQPLAIRVESHHRTSVILDRTLERRGGRGLEAEEHE